MAGETVSEHEHEVKPNLVSAPGGADEKHSHAIELFTLQHDQSLSESKENQIFIQQHKYKGTSKIISEDGYLSSDDRNLFQYKLINGFDVLTLTIIRVFLQVAYKEFTGENTVPFMEAITEDPALAGPIVTLLCLLAFIEIYQVYQHQQAKKLRNDAGELAKFRQNLEVKTEKTAKEQIEDLQEKVDLILAEDSELQKKYAALSVQYEIEKDNTCRVYLVATPSLKAEPAPEGVVDQDQKPVENNSNPEKEKKGINWPSVGSFLWEVFNISAVVYWVEWGLRNLVKPGGFGVGFGPATGMNVLIPFGIVLPVIVPLAMIAPKLFNYINNHHSPTDKETLRLKLWDGIRKLFKPTPNPLQGTRFQFLGYIASEIANFFRNTVGFFLVAPTMLGIGIKKGFEKLSAIPGKSPKPHSPSEEAVVDESRDWPRLSLETGRQFTADAASIVSRAILLDKYGKAGVTLANLKTKERKPDEAEVVSPQSDESPILSKDSSQSALITKQQNVTPEAEGLPQAKRSNFSWFSLFALRAAIGYIYLQFTLGWWVIDLIDIFNPGVDIAKIATVMAGVILGLSAAYALGVMVHRKREYDEYYRSLDTLNNEERAKKEEYQNKLVTVKQAEAEADARQVEEQALSDIAIEQQIPEYKNCPKIGDKRYYSDIRISEKTKPWYGDYKTTAHFMLCMGALQTGIWIGRGSSIDFTAVHPWSEPWERTIPLENLLSDLEKHLAVVATVLLIAGFYFAAYRHNYNQDQIIAEEKQKVEQAGERLLHTRLQTTFWAQQKNINEATTPTDSGRERTRTSSPDTPPPSFDSVQESPESVPLIRTT
jgi:hypothetical protein